MAGSRRCLCLAIAWTLAILLASGASASGTGYGDPLALPARIPAWDWRPPAGQRNPLTGYLLAPGAAARSPIAFIIDNHPGARPQSGLGAADLIVELPAEGGITRHLAVFWSELPFRVGPVRSARDCLLEVARSLRAVLVHIGASPSAYEQLKAKPWPHFDAMRMNEGFVWVSFRRDPHRLYANAGELSALADARGWSGPVLPNVGWGFLGPRELPGAARAHWVSVKQPAGEVAEFAFDPRTGRYRRLLGGRIETDYETGEPIMLANLIVAYVPVRLIPGDTEGRLNVALSGTGRADVFARGYHQSGTWTGAGGLPLVRLSDGSEPRLSPGPTWVMIVPVGSAVDIR